MYKIIVLGFIAISYPSVINGCFEYNKVYDTFGRELIYDKDAF